MLHATQRRAPGDAAEDPAELELRNHVYASIPAPDAKGFQPMPAPKPGDLPAAQKESPQTLERYRLAARFRPTDERRTIVLQPLGPFDAEQAKLLEDLRDYAAAFFQLPARIEKPLPLEVAGSKLYRNVPLGHRHGTYDKQYDGNALMREILIPQLPKDALLYLGVTMADLYADAASEFAFGVASFTRRVGVYSLCRYYPEFTEMRRSPGDDVKALRRACKVLNHEAGHMLGITHCTFYRCSMNYSISLPELDATPVHYCPVCHRKLLWNIGFDPLKRFTALQEFYATHGMTEESEWIAGRLQRWQSVVATESVRKTQDE
ncbi:MAG: archaemetzincin [Planctomycetota bacterium]|nr:archaemetzincin [Planctomycetota bacterium]